MLLIWTTVLGLFFILSALSRTETKKHKHFAMIGGIALIPIAFLFLCFGYSVINQYNIFKYNKKLYAFYFLFGWTFIAFGGLSLNLSYYHGRSEYGLYYILTGIGALLLIIGDHFELSYKNIRNLPAMIQNVSLFAILMLLISFQMITLNSADPVLSILDQYFHFITVLYILLLALSYSFTNFILKDNIDSQILTLEILKDIQTGKVPEPPKEIEPSMMSESKSIPYNIYKISSIIKKHQESSAEQLNKLKEVDKLRAEFLRNVSHELRTPLTIILGYINIISIKLKKENLTQLNDYSENVKAQASILQRLVENILAFSKMEKKTMDLFISLVDIPSIFQKLLKEYEPMINHMDFKIIKKIMPFKIYADHDKLYTVFYELLNNSTKFTPKGGNILIKSEIVEQEDQDLARFIIQDSGIGIPEEKIEKSFQKFQQIDGEANREYGGTGMGLPLCKGIIELHNGRIHIKSKENHGTRITIDIPQKKGIIKRISAFSIPKDIDKNKNYFLIIEDDPLIGDLIKKYLEIHSIEGIVLNSGKEVNKILKIIKPIGVTLDTNLPDIDGWKVYENIKSYDKTLPVIIITEKDDKNYASKKGIKMYLSKPMDKELFDHYITQIQKNLKK